MPLISISGTQCMGKSTLVEDFKDKWKNYQRPIKTYRDILKEKNLPNNKETTPETQMAILDSMIESQKPYDRKRDYVIFDRSPLDALAYTLWAYEKKKDGFDDEYMENYISKVRQAMRDFDIMFFIPMTKYNPELEESDLRSSDSEFRKEVDNIFKSLVEAKNKGDDSFFYKEDCGPIIEVFGNRQERIEIIKLYINDNGNFYGEEDNLLLNALNQTMNVDYDVDYIPPTIDDFKFDNPNK